MEKKEKEVTTKSTVYIAFDGTEFQTEYECANYEKSELGVLLTELNCYGYCTEDSRDPLLDSFGCKYYVLMPRTRHDVFVLNRILELCGSDDRFLSDNLYKPIILQIYSYPFGLGKKAQIVLLDEWMKHLSGGKFSVVSLVKDNVQIKVAK